MSVITNGRGSRTVPATPARTKGPQGPGSPRGHGSWTYVRHPCMAHGLDLVLDAAQAPRRPDGIRFLLVGEGRGGKARPQGAGGGGEDGQCEVWESACRATASLKCMAANRSLPRLAARLASVPEPLNSVENLRVHGAAGRPILTRGRRGRAASSKRAGSGRLSPPEEVRRAGRKHPRAVPRTRGGLEADGSSRAWNSSNEAIPGRPLAGPLPRRPQPRSRAPLLERPMKILPRGRPPGQLS